MLLHETWTVALPAFIVADVDELVAVRPRMRFPFECREPGSERLKWNGDLHGYCRQCQGLQRFDKCLRADPSEIRRHLKQALAVEIPRVCQRCGTELEGKRDRYCDACEPIAQKEKEHAARRRQLELCGHPCAYPGCEIRVMPHTIYCRTHARQIRREQSQQRQAERRERRQAERVARAAERQAERVARAAERRSQTAENARQRLAESFAQAGYHPCTEPGCSRFVASHLYCREHRRQHKRDLAIAVAGSGDLHP